MNKLLILFLPALFINSCTEKKVVKNTPSTFKVKSQDSSLKTEHLNSQNIPSKVLNEYLQKSINCKDKGGDMSNGFKTECLYKNYTLEEAYQKFKEKNKDNDDGKFLENNIPKNNIEIPFEEYPISVKYSILKEGYFKIDLLFPGGLTVITFKKNEKDVKVTTVYSPD